MGVLVGKPAPDFTVPAVLGNGEIVDSFTLSEAIKGKYGLVFFYPLDFTFVCPSELIALDHRMDQFKSLGVEVIAVSIDRENSPVISPRIHSYGIVVLVLHSTAQTDKPVSTGLKECFTHISSLRANARWRKWMVR